MLSSGTRSPEPNPRWGASDDLGARQSCQHSPHERASITERVDRNLDLPVTLQAIERILNPIDWDRTSTGRPGRPNDRVVSFKTQYAILTPGHRSDRLALYRSKKGSGIRHLLPAPHVLRRHFVPRLFPGRHFLTKSVR
jgi:hypothetical protein